MKIKSEYETLKTLTKLLENTDTDFILTGSFLLTFYQIPRATRDIDILISSDIKNTEKFIKEISKKFIIPQDIKKALKKGAHFNIIDPRNFLKIDFFVVKKEKFDELKKRAKRVSLKEFQLLILSLTDFIISKIEWIKKGGSEIHKSDIVKLVGVLNKKEKNKLFKELKEKGYYEEIKEIFR